MKQIFEKLKNGLIVSCQAEGSSPFNSPEGVAMFAKAAQDGGAAAIRSEGIEKSKKIIESVSLPIVGLVKSYFEDGSVRITGSQKDYEDLLNIGCSIIAVDGTFRKRELLSGPDFIYSIKSKYDCIIMADIATVEEGIASAQAGADCVSTTLSGYTPETKKKNNYQPDFELVKQLSQKLQVPIFAEGRINTPELAVKIINYGAWGVVVGSAITRPSLITEWFCSAISSGIK
ncbi:MAG: N-acetylmannosamine-6-phosphate 2-epimerase [Ignavibacteria bacterium]|nr:N-acetylmannosamine-6-phosphate 2-epimerase [Ignavibacteria bacterium]